MSKRFIQLLLLTGSAFVIYSCENRDYVRMQFKAATRMKTAQFKGTPPPDQLHYVAQTRSGISIKCDDGKNIHTYTACRVGWVLDESSSWIRHDRFFDSVQLMEHESGHLRLAIIQAKKLDIYLRKNKYHQFIDRLTMDELAADAEKQLDEIQATYDRETLHGTNVPAQNKWDSSLIADLMIYYKSPSDILNSQTNHIPPP